MHDGGGGARGVAGRHADIDDANLAGADRGDRFAHRDALGLSSCILPTAPQNGSPGSQKVSGAAADAVCRMLAMAPSVLPLDANCRRPSVFYARRQGKGLLIG